MVHDGNESLQLHIAIELIDGLLFLVARWPDIHRKALNVSNTLSDWTKDQRTPTPKEWSSLMDDTTIIRDWFQARAEETQDFIDSKKPTEPEEEE